MTVRQFKPSKSYRKFGRGGRYLVFVGHKITPFYIVGNDIILDNEPKDIVTIYNFSDNVEKSNILELESYKLTNRIKQSELEETRLLLDQAREVIKSIENIENIQKEVERAKANLQQQFYSLENERNTFYKKIEDFKSEIQHQTKTFKALANSSLNQLKDTTQRIIELRDKAIRDIDLKFKSLDIERVNQILEKINKKALEIDKIIEKGKGHLNATYTELKTLLFSKTNLSISKVQEFADKKIEELNNMIRKDEIILIDKATKREKKIYLDDGLINVD